MTKQTNDKVCRLYELELLLTLENSESSQICFINEQFKHENFSHNDMYSELGRLATLDDTRDKIKVLREFLDMDPKVWKEIHNGHAHSYSMTNE
tara:strand:+ start:8014 stop:8295 length:282 start_codon:yes stop_codon:yes gene_type:complete